MTTLSFDILYRDRGAAKGMQDLARHTDKTAASLKGLKVASAIGLVAATGAAIKFGTSSVKAYAEAQTAQNKLQDAFAKFPKLADTNISSLRALNTALAQKTRFDDDATASGQAVLAQFKLTGQQITQLTPLLQDYAAKTGKDLPTAARDLGKAMLGQGRSLKAVGIDFKDTGTAGGNFAEIMGGLRTQVGGFAEKEGKTAAGQAEILKNQFGELQESVGQALLPALSKVGGGLLKVVNGFNGLSDSTKTTLVTIGGGILTLGLAAMAVGKLAVGVRAARDAFKVLGISSDTVRGKIANIDRAAVAAVAGFVAVQAASAALDKQLNKNSAGVDGYANSLIDLGRSGNQLDSQFAKFGSSFELVGQGVDDTASAFKALHDAQNPVAEGFKTIGDALGMSSTLGILTDEFGKLDQALVKMRPADAAAAFRKLSAEASAAGISLDDQLSIFSAYKNSLVEQANALHVTGLSAQDYGDWMGGKIPPAVAAAGNSTETAGAKIKTAGEKAADANTKIKALAATMFDASKGALALSGSEISFQQAVDDATAAVKTNGRTLDTHTQKGRDNKTALNNLVTSSQNYIAKLVETGASTKTVTAKTRDAKEEFIRVATKMGVSSARAKDLATKYFAIPKGVKTKVEQPGMSHAIESAKELATRIAGIKNKAVKLSMQFNANATKAAVNFFKTVPGSQASGFVGAFQGHVKGGPIQNVSGRGVKGKDTELVATAVGEHVWTDKEVDAVGGHGAMYRMRADARSGAFKGYVQGGAISRSLKINTKTGKIPSSVGYWVPAGVAAGSNLGGDATRELGSDARKALDAAIAASFGAGGGPIGKGGYAKALAWGRAHRGHPYVFGTLFDCSGFMSALHSIILGQSPHRRYTTTAFHGAHAAGFTRGKRSPFMVGVRPLAGKFGHMAGTLNGVNVESAGGVGVRLGSRARGYNNSMFSWRGGLAEGGPVRRGQGDLPFDLLDPQGERYNPELAGLLHKVGYANGTNNARRGIALVGENGPELVRMRGGERVTPLARPSYARTGGGGGVGNVVYNVTINAPNYVGSQSELRHTLVTMARRGELEVIKR